MAGERGMRCRRMRQRVGAGIRVDAARSEPPPASTRERRSARDTSGLFMARTGFLRRRTTKAGSRASMSERDPRRLAAEGPPASPSNQFTIELAGVRGACAGVDRAIASVEAAVAAFGAPVYVRKKIVHNDTVVSRLEERGAVFVDGVADAPDGCTIVVSAHGAP